VGVKKMKYKEYFSEYLKYRQSLGLSDPQPVYADDCTLVQFAQSGANREATCKNRWVTNFSVSPKETVTQRVHPLEAVKIPVIRVSLNSPADLYLKNCEEIDWRSFSKREGWYQ
jgi:hypothetical protein